MRTQANWRVVLCGLSVVAAVVVVGPAAIAPATANAQAAAVAAPSTTAPPARPTAATGDKAAATAPATATATATALKLELIVTVEHKAPLKLGPAELAKLPRRTVRAADHGKDATFEGWSLGDVLQLAGAELGGQPHGAEPTQYVLVAARDGYRALFALPELDTAFTDRQILLADRRDQEPLSNEEGPLRIVVPGEKRGARWVRQVTALTVLQAPPAP